MAAVRAQGQIRIQSRTGRAHAQFVDGLVVDAAAVVSSLVPVEVVLILAAELEQVIAFQPGDVVTEHLVMAVPEAGTALLRVDVVGTKVLGVALTRKYFQRSTQTLYLRRVSGSGPLPPVAQEAVVEIVCNIRRDVGGQPRNPEPCLLRIAR